jgi:hypothetical protein
MDRDIFHDIDDIVYKSTLKSIREVLGAKDDERSKQDQLQDDLDDLKSGGKKSSKDEFEEADPADAPTPKEKKSVDTDETPTPATPSVEEITDATIDDIVDKLNMLRSGKSTKDKDVRDQLASYWDGLQPGEQQSLFAYLTGLTQIMTAGTTGADATDPGSVGIKITPKKKTRDQAEAEEPADDLGEKERKPNDEEAPIIVGEVARKKDLLRMVLEIMK